MTLQDMPIMDRLHIGGRIEAPPSKAVVVDRAVFEHLASFKRVRLNDIDRVATPPDALWNVRKIFGHLALPFPRLWIEWNNTRDDGGTGLPSLWMAAACESFKSAVVQPEWCPVELHENSWMVRPLALHGGRVLQIPMALIVELNSDGLFKGLYGMSVRGDGTTGSTPMDVAAVVDMLWDALVAVGWMNCRNVEVRHHSRERKTSKSKGRRRERSARSLDFHTIHLPGREANDGLHDSAGGPGGGARLHQVRGHFKTFTEAAPLMGKHTGTYWWGWQLRGDRRNGSIISDYQINRAS